MISIGKQHSFFFRPELPQSIAAQVASQLAPVVQLFPPLLQVARAAQLAAPMMPTPSSRYAELRETMSRFYAPTAATDNRYGIPDPGAVLDGLSNIAQQTGGNDATSILSDPSLTVEDKVMLLLMTIMKDMDKEIEGQTNRIEAMQKQQNRGGANAASPSIDVETTKLTRLTTKRAQMFDTLRSIMDKYNQTAKGVIDSMSR